MILKRRRKLPVLERLKTRSLGDKVRLKMIDQVIVVWVVAVLIVIHSKNCPVASVLLSLRPCLLGQQAVKVIYRRLRMSEMASRS